jgi:hypothetical protein
MPLSTGTINHFALTVTDKTAPVIFMLTYLVFNLSLSSGQSICFQMTRLSWL